MNNKEKLKIWKGKLIELEEKIKQLNAHKFILVNIFNELNKGKNIKLNNLLHDIELQEDISYLNDWIEFYLKGIEKYEAKSKRLKQAISEEALEKRVKEKDTEIETKKGIEDSFKFIFKKVEEERKTEIKVPKIRLKERFAKFKVQKPLVRYTIPFVILLLIFTSVFLLKPAITGLVVSKEIIYSENLYLDINESGTYEWKVKNVGNIKSIKATGSVIGNGTVKIYIEKDGKRYLIYTNK